MSSNIEIAEPATGILLLGADGLLGRACAQEIQRRGLSAVCLDRTACDVTSSDQVLAVFDRFAPTTLINCTAYTKVDLAERERDQAFAVNAIGVANLAQACSTHRTRLIHFSTDFVFDGRSTVPYQPHDQTAGLSVYGQSKLRGEMMLRDIDPPGWMIVRTAWLFGVTGPCFPRTILDRAMNGQPLKIVNDQIGSPTYTPDLAAAVLDLIGRRVTGIHHLTNAGKCSWFEFAKAVLAEFATPADIHAITTADLRRLRPDHATRPAYSVLQDSEIDRLLPQPMRPWPQALTAYRAASSEK